jgi:hypothetical protein
MSGLLHGQQLGHRGPLGQRGPHASVDLDAHKLGDRARQARHCIGRSAELGTRRPVMRRPPNRAGTDSAAAAVGTTHRAGRAEIYRREGVTVLDPHPRNATRRGDQR